MQRRLTGSGVVSAVLVVMGAVDILLVGGLSIRDGTDPAWAPLIAGVSMLVLGILRTRRAAAGPLVVVVAVLAAAGYGWARVEYGNDQSQRPLQRVAPPLHEGYPYVGNAGGVHVGLRWAGDQVSWRVNVDGTDNCRPVGKTALWNFTEGVANVDNRGRFHVDRTYSSPDRGGDGKQYSKQVDYRLRGRFGAPGAARGTYWRRDRFYSDGELALTCTRAGRWRAYGA